MGHPTSLQQFIFGKLARGSGYRITAATTGLADCESELLQIQGRYTLIGSQALRTVRAAGTFMVEDELVAVQATTSDTHEPPAFDAQGRPFVQHRYVFVPRAAAPNGYWRLTELVLRLAQQPIPVYDDSLTELEPLESKLLLPQPLSAEGRLSLMTQSLTLRDEKGRRLALVVLEALLTGRRVLCSISDNFEEMSKLIDTALGLLPAPYRTRFGFIVGFFDERNCPWASLLLRFNGGPSVQPDLAYIDLANAKVVDGAQGAAPRSRYVRLLSALVERQAPLARVFEILDKPTEDDGPPERLNDKQLPISLIGLLESSERTAVWSELLRDASLTDVDMMLPAIQQTGELESLWAHAITQSGADWPRSVELLALAWRAASDEQRATWALADLATRPKIGAALAKAGLLELAATGPQRSSIRRAAEELVAALAQEEPRLALALARDLAASPLAADAVERLQLLDRAADALGRPADLVDFFCEDIAPLLWLAPHALHGSRTYRVMASLLPEALARLERLLDAQAEALGELPALADACRLDIGRRSTLYAGVLEAWEPASDKTGPLLGELIVHSVQGSSDGSPQELALGRTAAWFTRHHPGALALAQKFTRKPDWWGAESLGQMLYSTRRQRLQFSDQIMGGKPARALLAMWLEGLAAEPAIRPEFMTSLTLAELRRSSDLALAAFVELANPERELRTHGFAHALRDLQATLDLSTDALFLLVEWAGERRMSGGITLHQASDLLGLYLRYGWPLYQERSLIWAIVQKREPLLAGLFHDLQSGAAELTDIVRRIVLASPEHASLLVAWLQFTGRPELLEGVLLEQIVAGWERAGTVDSDLAAQINALAAAGLTIDSWVLLCTAGWLPGGDAVNIGRPAAPLAPSYLAWMKEVAHTRLRRNPSPELLHRIIADLARVNADPEILLSLLAAAPPSYGGVSLVTQIVGNLPEASLTRTNVEALQLLGGLRPTTEGEQQLVRRLLTAVLTTLLDGPLDNVGLLTSRLALITASPLYGDALGDAALSLASRLSTEPSRRVNLLRQAGLTIEAHTLTAALENFWQTVMSQQQAESSGRGVA